VLLPAAAHAAGTDAASSSRHFRMMELSENWSRKAKRAKSWRCCLMWLSADKASYVTEDRWGSFAFSYPLRCGCQARDRLGAGAEPAEMFAPGSPAAPGRAAPACEAARCLLKGLHSFEVFMAHCVSSIRQVLCSVRSKETEEWHPANSMVPHCYF